MKLPTKFDVVLCEGLREEARKKLTLLGVFVGDDVVIDHGTPVESINLKLVYLARFKDGVGETAIRWSIRDPDNNVVNESPEEIPIEMKRDGYSIVVIEYAGHKVSRYGTYKLVVVIGDTEYPFEYRIKEGPPPP